MNFFKRLFTLSSIPLVTFIMAVLYPFLIVQAPLTVGQGLAVIALVIIALSGALRQLWLYDGMPSLSTYNVILKKIFDEINFTEGEYRFTEIVVREEWMWLWKSPATGRKVFIEMINRDPGGRSYTVTVNGTDLKLSSFDKKMISKLFLKGSQFGNKDKEISTLNATLSEMIDESNEIKEKQLMDKLKKMQLEKDERFAEVQEMTRKDPPKVSA